MAIGKARTPAQRLRALLALKRSVATVLREYDKLRAQERRFNRAMQGLAAAGWRSTIPHRYRF